jgi:hypothetical protein
MFLGWENVSAEQVLKHLKELRGFFGDSSAWIYWPMAIDPIGLEVEYNSNKACKWSFIGASQLISEKNYQKPMCDFVDCATREFLRGLYTKSFPETYEEEYSIICLAIEKLERELHP